MSLRRGLYKHITVFDYYRRPNAPYIKGHQTDQTIIFDIIIFIFVYYNCSNPEIGEFDQFDVL